MNSEVRVIQFKDIRTNLITFFKSNSLIPIVGSGLSCGSKAFNGQVPTGKSYMDHMLEMLTSNDLFTPEEKKQLNKSTFSTLCDYYEDDENVLPETRFLYLKNNFFNASLDDNDIRKCFFKINWPYIYSLNIDDVIENASEYNTIIKQNRPFRNEIFDEKKCLIKLHGDITEIVTYKDGDKIFTSKEYALSVGKNTSLLNKLRNDYAYQNILYIGCSLDDEIDLKTLKEMPINFQQKNNLNRTIIFVKNKPGKLQISKYKTYGITDIVYFDDYNSMYQLLLDAWIESQKIQNNEIECFGNITLSSLKSNQINDNQNYFFWGKGLLNSKLKTLCYPYYFISRNISFYIINNLRKNKVHLIYGNRLSGKSYLLADLYRTIRDRKVYYFNGISRLSDNALNNLIDSQNIIALLDTGTLDRKQFETVLLNAKRINSNCNNFIINVNINDGDTLGIVKWKLKEHIIADTDIFKYTLDNKLISIGKINELDTVNNLLPYVNLPLYNHNRTFLDQLIFAEHELQVKGKYSKQHIEITTTKQLALLIALAIKEKLYSLNIINFSFDQEISEALKKYHPFIERIDTNTFEKKPSDLSSVKYVLNSKYWLRRELGDYARNKKNYNTIADAYKYIISKIIEFSGDDEFKKRRLCRDYVLFDVMNDIFLDQYYGNLSLIVYIYTNLHELLANDYNFLHQNAKCYINYSYILKSNTDKKKYLEDALQLVAVSKSMVENEYNHSGNEHLQISLAHTQYTTATALSELCKVQDFDDAIRIENTIDAIYEALSSPYNSDDYQRERSNKHTSRGIISFIKHFSCSIDDLSLDKVHYSKLNDLINNVLFKTAF